MTGQGMDVHLPELVAYILPSLGLGMEPWTDGSLERDYALTYSSEEGFVYVVGRLWCDVVTETREHSRERGYFYNLDPVEVAGMKGVWLHDPEEEDARRFAVLRGPGTETTLYHVNPLFDESKVLGKLAYLANLMETAGFEPTHAKTSDPRYLQQQD